MFRDIKLTQKIFFIFILMIVLIMNSWAFTFTTVLDFRDSFDVVRQYSFPSIVTTSQLKDDVHVALLGVYNYIATGDEASKTVYKERFNSAIETEYQLFQLSQTATDFEFTQQFNDKLLAVYNAADDLVNLYENDPADPTVAEKLTELNMKRDAFNDFVASEITNQISQQVDTADNEISQTVSQIQLYLIGISALVLVIVVFVILFISNNITKPVKALTKAAQEFGKGHFKKVQITRNDELGLFAKTFNTMAENIQASQHALEEELEKTKELDRQKSEFLSIAAHQLRTPMAGIRWVSQMLYDGDMGTMTDEQKHHLGNALENINRMISLINDLLDITKIEEQRFKYKFVVTDIVKICRDQVEALAELAKGSNVTVKVLHEPAGEILAEVDVEKLSLAVNNLIDNAIKYSPKDSTVEVGVIKHGSNVHCYVKDHGLGIPKSSQSEVFTKFFRAPNVLKVITEGSGLGLFLVKDIIVKHEGKIWFESAEGTGTTFFIDLPVAQPKTDARPTLTSLTDDSVPSAQSPS
jgi:signal transduction histidine kinase